MRPHHTILLLLCLGAASLGHIGCSGTGSPLAGTCAEDGDCVTGLRCLAASGDVPALGGGPANGYCSKNCAMDSDCAGFEGARCAGDANGQNGICVLTCAIGPALTFADDPLDPMKCNGRDDLRCTVADVNTNICLPNCGRDSQCPPGRSCDPLLAVCVDTPSAGKPLGAPCDPKDTMPECAGYCEVVTDGAMPAGACTSPCVLGGTTLETPNCGGIENGFCIYRDPPNGAGDIGSCARACLKQDDCAAPALWCLGLEGFTGAVVTNGYCFSAVPCPNGQGDCKFPHQTCTQTSFGPFCLDPAFPLGSTAPG